MSSGNNQYGRMLGGTGTLYGPSHNTQFNMVVGLIASALPFFAKSAQEEGIVNENGLNRRLARFITNISGNNDLPYFAQPESMEDETRGDSPATDIGIYIKVEDCGIDPPLITVFEGKRLSTKLPKKRRREYVIGHEEDGKLIHCGGIERFKLALHGAKLSHAGMIGYLQDGTPDSWRENINTWISALIDQPCNPEWTEQEKLTPQTTYGRVTKCSSKVSRSISELQLAHLWIDLTH